VSYDEGKTWAVSKQYFPSLFGYSALTILPNGDWAILAENGTSTYYDKITFISDSLSNLTSGADTLNSPPVLKIGDSNANLLISWPTSSVPYILQEASFQNETNWTTATGVISMTITNGQNQFLLLRTNIMQLFRLANP
jgi:hypothetical protein